LLSCLFDCLAGNELVPAYIEFFSVKKILATMGQEPDLKSKSNADIRRISRNARA